MKNKWFLKIFKFDVENFADSFLQYISYFEIIMFCTVSYLISLENKLMKLSWKN